MGFELREDIDGGKNMWLDSLGDVEDTVFYVFSAITALIVVLSLAIIVLSCYLKHISPGFSMDFYIATGCVLLSAHILMSGLHLDWGDRDDYKAVCQLAPSLLLFGWLFITGGMLFKVWAFIHYFTGGKNKTIRRSEWIPNFGMVILMMIMAALVVIWAIEYPLTITQHQIGNETTPAEDALWWCEGDKMEEWKIATSAFLGVVLLGAATIVWGALHVARKSALNGEANSLCVLVYNTLFSVVAGALVYFFYEDDRNILYAIVGGIHYYVMLISQIVLIDMKIKGSRRKPRYPTDRYEDLDEQSTSGGINPAHDGAVHKTEADFNY